MSYICRKAMEADVDGIEGLIRHYAERGIMLPRSAKAIRDQIDTFVVAEQERRIVGCGSLYRLGRDLAEIRSLGVAEACKGNGIGRQLVMMLTEAALDLGIPKLMALTYEIGFFERLGFEVVPKDIFPEKVWTDCVYCSKQHCCDEIAVLKRLT